MPTTRGHSSTRQRRRVLAQWQDWPLIELGSARPRGIDCNGALLARLVRSEAAKALRAPRPSRVDTGGSRPASTRLDLSDDFRGTRDR